MAQALVGSKGRAVLVFVLFYLVLIFRAGADLPQPARVLFVLHLKRGDFTIYHFVPGDPAFARHPRAVVVFGSGDGGFDGSEDRVGQALQAGGYEMLGFDCSAYADSDYDLATLQADTNTIAQSALGHEGPNPPPLILGGWSMGAAQAVAAAGGPQPPAGLVGLLLLSPEKRGRYGLRTADRLDVTPTGPGTFALSDFARSLGKVRIAQWNAELDPFGYSAWLNTVTVPHKSYEFFSIHDYNQFSDNFLKLLIDSVGWILSPPPDPAASRKNP